MNSIELRLFGAFRRYSDSPSIRLEVPPGLTVAELKNYIARHLVELRPNLGNADLVFDSALANEREVMADETRVTGSCTLAILPPVCGG